jgi:hypothetical protein
LIRNRFGYFALNRENICQITVVSLRPQVGIISRIAWPMVRALRVTPGLYCATEVRLIT